MRPAGVGLQLGQLRGDLLAGQRLRVGLVEQVALGEQDEGEPLVGLQAPRLGRIGERVVAGLRAAAVRPRDEQLQEVLAAVCSPLRRIRDFADFVGPRWQGLPHGT